LHGYSLQSLNRWQTCISQQIEKYANRIDVLSAWQRREFFILEKMNQERFEQHLKLIYGSAWSFATDMQSSKFARLRKGSRRPRSPRKWWSQVLQGGWFRLRGKKGTRPEIIRDGWYVVIVSFVKSMESLDDRNTWQAAIYNEFRRLGKQSKP
jgi:hypothetical protein